MLAAPAIINANSTQQVFDFAPIQPFSAMNIVDGDNEAMFARVTIDNGVNRGDFLPWTANGWQRSVNGSDIVYTRSFAATENIGNVVQGAVRALDFQPRVNAIPGGMRELTQFEVFLYDQTATANNDQTLVQTISINDPPVVGGATANQEIQDSWTVLPFANMTVTDADNQAANITVTIDSGTVRGDFTPASAAGWTRTVNGFDIVYTRVFQQTSNVGDSVQSALRSLTFKPRENAIAVGTKETTQFDVRVSDGIAWMTNSATTIVTTSRNDAPGLSGGNTTQFINSDETINPFNIIDVVDVDFQDMFLTVAIQDAHLRGDFTSASTVGWTRTVLGNEVRYTRYLPVGANVGSRANTALRALVFQPRTGIPVGAEEYTQIRVMVNDGVQSPNTVTYIETTGV